MRRTLLAAWVLSSLLPSGALLAAPPSAPAPSDPRSAADRRALDADPFAEAPLHDLLSIARRDHATDALVADYAARAAASPSRRITLGRIELALGERQKGVADLSRAASAPDLAARPATALGALLESLGARKEAVAAYDRARTVAAPGDVAQIAMHAGQLLVAAGQVAEAKKRFALAEAAAPRDLELRRHMADALAGHGAFKDALALLEGARPLAGDVAAQVALVRRIGELRARTGDWRGAGEAYLDAWRLAPPGSGARTDLAPQLIALYRAHGHLPELAQTAAKGDGAWDHVLAGDVELASGKKVRAADQYRAAIARDPSLVDARQRLVATGTLPAAERAQIERDLVAARPDNPSVHLELGRALFDAGQPDVATKALVDAAGRFRGAPYVEFEIASLLARHDRCADAVPIYERALAADAHNPDYQQARGDCYVKLGDKAHAVAAYRAMLGATADTNAYRHVIALVRARSLTDEVRTLYTEALARFPTDDELRRDFAAWLGDSNDLPAAIAEWKRLADKAAQPSLRELASYQVARLERRQLLQKD